MGNKFFLKQIFLGKNFWEQVLEEQILLGRNFWEQRFLEEFLRVNFILEGKKLGSKNALGEKI